MPREIWEYSVKASTYWITELVNEHPSVLDQAIAHGTIEWLSPTEDEENARYSDDAALERVGICLIQRPLLSFLPANQPYWDALGLLDRGAPVFVDVKAHAPELRRDMPTRPGDSVSPRLRHPVLTGNEYRWPIDRSALERPFAEVWRAWGISGSDAWFGPYFQYAHRLAYAYLLNEVNDAPAFVVFLYVIGATAVRGPTTRAEWESPIRTAQEALGVAGRLPPYIVEAYVDVSGPIPRAA